MKTEPSARILQDSISVNGDRLTTMEVVCHRFVLAEFNTHRAFSRNSASSRAVPFKTMMQRVLLDPAMPLSWPKEQKGMQGGEEFQGPFRRSCELHWLRARDEVAIEAKILHELGVHKSLCNRLLEPFLWHTIVVTSTEWENFFVQRCSPLAMPEIRVVAAAMRDALAESEPKLTFEWHLPFVDDEEHVQLMRSDIDPRKVSVARCARVSYLTHDGERHVGKDLELYERLRTAVPPHASPFEHVAIPVVDIERPEFCGNFTGWRQLRHEVFGDPGWSCSVS